MKKKIIYTIALLCLTFSCKKYEEGPKISFRSAKSRVEGKWKVTSYIYKNEEQLGTWDYQNAKVLYCKSGGFVPGQGAGLERNGYVEFTMEFSSDGNLTNTFKSNYEVIDENASEEQCKAIWNLVKSETNTDKYTWELDHNKENIILKHSNTNSTYQIIRLKEKNMHLKNTSSSGNIYEYVMEKI